MIFITVTALGVDQGYSFNDQTVNFIILWPQVTNVQAYATDITELDSSLPM